MRRCAKWRGLEIVWPLANLGNLDRHFLGMGDEMGFNLPLP
jgi:hypothetical protein